MPRNPLVIALVTAVLAVATLIFAFVLAPFELVAAPAFIPAAIILVLVEILTGAALAVTSTRSWSAAQNIVRAAIPVTLGGWTLLSAGLMVGAAGMTPRLLLVIQLAALVAVTIVLGGLAMASGHVAVNDAASTEGASLSEPLRQASRTVVALLDRQHGLPPALVSRCRAAAEQVRSIGESSLRAKPAEARAAVEILNRLCVGLQEAQPDHAALEASSRDLEGARIRLG
jgi:hypothetical protein